MNAESMIKAAERLVDKAAYADSANDALNYSQAACNAANALVSLIEHSRDIEKNGSRIGYTNGADIEREAESVK